MADRDKKSFSYSDAVSSKWGRALLDEGFVPFPKRLLRCAPRLFRGELRMSELCCVLAIADFQRPQLLRKPSLSHLANVAGLTERRFRRCIQSLASRGLLEWRGTEEAIDFDYTPLLKRVMKLTRQIGDEHSE